MVYYRRRRYARRRYARRRKATSWYNKKYSVAQLATKAIKGVSYLKGLVNSELFKIDRTGSVTVHNGGNVINLTGIVQGDGDGERTGNSIFVKNVIGTFALSDTVPSRIRIMLVKDTQQVGDTSITGSMILQHAGTGMAPLSMLNKETVGRFTILKSRVYTLYPDKPAVTVRLSCNMRHHIRYNGPTGNDIQKGGLHFVLFSEQNSGASNTAFCAYTTRVSYHDN